MENFTKWNAYKIDMSVIWFIILKDTFVDFLPRELVSVIQRCDNTNLLVFNKLNTALLIRYND